MTDSNGLISNMGKSLLDLFISTFHTIQNLVPPDPISQLGVISAWCAGIIAGIIISKLWLTKV